MNRSDLVHVAADDDPVLLETLRALERRRIQAIRQNDAETMSEILDDKFLYINSDGTIYDKKTYLLEVRSHKLTYSTDVDLTETDHRVDGDVIILAGEMLGHARLDGEAQVYHLRSMRVWRRRESAWRLLAWQSSTLLRPPIWSTAQRRSSPARSRWSAPGCESSARS